MTRASHKEDRNAHGKKVIKCAEDIYTAACVCERGCLCNGESESEKTVYYMITQNTLPLFHALQWTDIQQRALNIFIYDCSHMTKVGKGWFPFLSVLWIINLKKIHGSIQCLQLIKKKDFYSERPTWTFEFQHDSRLYEGICVHVCIYLFMCNLMGIVNMVSLLKLLFLFIWCLLF